MRRLGGALLAALVASQTCAQGTPAPAAESIYRQGIARREPDLKVSGIDAACSNCHRRSEGVEGRPVNYLMLHYALDEPDMAAFIAYLKGR
jgi:hypothetical protein